MAGVFLSYSRGDRALAGRVLKGLRAIGVDVWWDEDMPGVDWQEELARQINELAAVVVIWTPLSTNSKNVRDEARLGQHQDKLVNVLVGVTAPPFPFDRTNGLRLDGWTGSEPHNGWTKVVATIEDHAASMGGVERGELLAALADREQAIDAAGARIAAAQEAFAAAQGEEDAAVIAAADSGLAVTAAEDLLRIVLERRAGGAMLRAAQADLEAAQQGAANAAKQKSEAGRKLANASRGLSRAKADLDELLERPRPPARVPPARTPRPVSMPIPGAPLPLETPHAPDPAPTPATTDARPASASTSSDEGRHPSRAETAGRAARKPTRGLPVLLAAGGAVAAVIVLIALLSGQKPQVALAGQANTNVAQPSPAAPIAQAAPAQAPAPQSDPAAALVGSWSIAGVGCSHPITFADTADSLTQTFGGRTVNVHALASATPGALAFRDDDGTRYDLSGGKATITLVGASRPEAMTRCAG